MSSNASQSAAGDQESANNRALKIQQQENQQNQLNLAPYNILGQDNAALYGNFYGTTSGILGNAINAANAHIPQPMTEANLVQTPGYQFNLSQGLKAAQNSAAAHGLGVSGAAINSASNYATGLADSTYQNQFNNQQSIYNDYANQVGLNSNALGQVYNQIGGIVGLGENAAAGAGNLGQASANSQSSLLNNSGTAAAAGATGSAGAIASGLNGASNAGINALAAQNLLGNSLGANKGGSDQYSTGDSSDDEYNSVASNYAGFGG